MQLVERALHRGAILEVEPCGIAAEPDQQLPAVGQQPVDHEIAERVRRARSR